MSSLTAEDNEGRIPLHFAARRGNKELVKYFLTQLPRQSRDAADEMGRTAFHYAVESRRVQILEVLRDHGLDIRRTDRQHRTVLHYAARANNLNAVKKIISMAGAEDLGTRDVDNKTPFEAAEQSGAQAVVDHLRSEYNFPSKMTTIPDCPPPFQRLYSTQPFHARLRKLFGGVHHNLPTTHTNGYLLILLLLLWAATIIFSWLVEDLKFPFTSWNVN